MPLPDDALSSEDRRRLGRLRDELDGRPADPPTPPLADPAPTVPFAPPNGNSPTPMVISTLGGYALDKKVGEGGMGQVYRVTKPELPNKHYALKIVHPNKYDFSFKERFLEEMAITASLSDRQMTGIAPVLTAGEDHGVLYYVTPFIPGCTLRNYLERNGYFRPDHAAKIVAKVAKSLACVHDNGIVHRDIKCSNIILSEHDSPVIIDFGLARKFREQLDPTAPTPGAYSPKGSHEKRRRIK